MMRAGAVAMLFTLSAVHPLLGQACLARPLDDGRVYVGAAGTIREHAGNSFGAELLVRPTGSLTAGLAYNSIDTDPDIVQRVEEAQAMGSLTLPFREGNAACFHASVRHHAEDVDRESRSGIPDPVRIKSTGLRVGFAFGRGVDRTPTSFGAFAGGSVSFARSEFAWKEINLRPRKDSFGWLSVDLAGYVRAGRFSIGATLTTPVAGEHDGSAPAGGLTVGLVLG